MKPVSPYWLEIITDIFVNLASGWFAGALATLGLFILQGIGSKNSSLLIAQLAGGIITVMLAKRAKEVQSYYEI